jgi:hypothetical protein
MDRMSQIVWMMRILIVMWAATAAWIYKHQVPIDELNRRLDLVQSDLLRLQNKDKLRDAWIEKHMPLPIRQELGLK